MDLVNYDTGLPACYGSSSCPNAPNPCYCTGKCTINQVYGPSPYEHIKPALIAAARKQLEIDSGVHLLRKPAPINAAHAAKIATILEHNKAQPVFVREHNEQKDVTTTCSTHDYQRPKSLAPGQSNQAAVTERNAEVTEARKCNAADRSALEQRINSGELDPGINAGRLVMPKEAQLLEAQLIQDALSEVADQVALAGAVSHQFAPMKAVLDGLEDILRYKNKAYGNSGLSEVGVLSKSSALEKLLARADDKIARIKNSDTLRKNDICDLLGYLVLICAKQGWNNFEEYQD